MSAGLDDLRRLGDGPRLADLTRVPDGPGAYAVWPAEGRAAAAIGLTGGAETALYVEAAERSLREALAEHLAPAHAGDSDLRAELAVWLAEVRGELPWSRQTRLGAEPDGDDRLLTAHAERALTGWMRDSLRATWVECGPRDARRLRDRAAEALQPALLGAERAPLWRGGADVVDERAIAGREAFLRREVWVRWLASHGHRLLDDEPGRRFVCRLDRDQRPQSAPRSVPEGQGAGKGWAVLPPVDPEDARRLLLEMGAERWYGPAWAGAQDPPPPWETVVDDLGDVEAMILVLLSRLRDDAADPFGENAAGPPGSARVDEGEGSNAQAIFEALFQSFPPGH
jgi:hypothetical protein